MSILARFAQMAKQQPQTVALITERSQLVFEDVLDLVHVLDVELMTRGVRPGQTLVLDSVRGEFMVLFSLLLSLRGYQIAFIAVDTALAHGLYFDRAIVMEPNDRLSEDRQIVVDAGWFRAVGTLQTPDYTGHNLINGTGGAFISQTSGSTGRPKFVKTNEVTRLSALEYSAGIRDMSPLGHRFLSTASARASLTVNVSLAVLLNGGSMVILSKSQDKLLSYIDMYRVDCLTTAPAILAKLIEVDTAQSYLRSLTHIRLSGAQASTELLDRLTAVSDAKIELTYGSTETGSIFVKTYDPDDEDGIGYLGQLVRKDFAVEILNDDGTLAADGVAGAVRLRSLDPVNSRTYISKEGEVDILSDGVFYPGDILKKVGEDYFYVGRTKNIINCGGNKFALESIQSFLGRTFAGSSFVCLVQADDNGIEQLVVVQSGGEKIDKAAVEHAVEKTFPASSVARVEYVDSFPLTQTGKVDVQSLKARFVVDNALGPVTPD